MFERHSGGERALLVNIAFSGPHGGNDPDEFAELAASAGVEVLQAVAVRRDAPHPAMFVGTGKAEELAALCREFAIEVVLFNHELTPAQERNLERAFCCRVVDRTGLILDIFAQRARSFEGKLQVELAQLQHLSTRLVRGWTHLERQKGGIGLRGPGETQLETDRRLIAQRIKQINARLDRVREQRRQSARSRRRALLSTVSLVGYTNAGKSTLFNQLASGDVYAADQLFATLDTTLRTMDVPGEHPVVLSDTVGFIRNLPPEVVAAFGATLDETRDADLLLHVIDAGADDRDGRIADVQGVLARIGAADVPTIEVYNKIDLLPARTSSVERGEDGRVRRVWLSALDGTGRHLLIDAIAEYLNAAKATRFLRVAPAAGRFRAMLYELGAIAEETELDEGGWLLEVTLSEARWQPFARSPEVARHVREVKTPGDVLGAPPASDGVRTA